MTTGGITEIAAPETFEGNLARFWHNYQALGGQDRAWFDEAVKPLLKLAMPIPDQVPSFHKPSSSGPLPWGPAQWVDYYSAVSVAS